MTRIHDIEISRRVYGDEDFKEVYWSVNYCGPDMLNPEVDSYCSNFKIKTYYIDSEDRDDKTRGSFTIEKQFPYSLETHKHFVYNTSINGIENRMHSICKQVAKLYLKKSVPPEFRDQVRIIDKTIKS